MHTLLLLLISLVACRDAEPWTSTSEDSGHAEEPSLGEVLGCNPDLDIFHTVNHYVSNILTVPRIRWESTENVQAYVVTDVGRETLLQSPLSEEPVLFEEFFVLGIPYSP